MPPELEVRLEGPLTGSPKEELGLSIDGTPVRMSLRISSLNRALVAALPDVLHDLLELAATVYTADCAVSRGGLTDAGFGERWRRRFHLSVPVRRPEIWRRDDVSRMLCDTLKLLSDDHWRFEFRARDSGGPMQGVVDYGQETGFRPGRIVMFSGGLNSLAGALEEMVARGEQVALVSHSSANKLARVQRDLVAAMQNRVGSDRFMHIRMIAQLGKGTRKEGTQRSRSFLYGALGIAVAEMFGLDSFSFYENGVVSVNLPPVGQVLGARATRTTHPRVLDMRAELYSSLLDAPRRISNPYLHYTKAEVVETIARLGFVDLIRQTHSCADVHNRTKMHSHCGRCSQCIDRRFAIIARGLEQEDPSEAYAVDLMTGPRRNVIDRELALSYVRNARFFSRATPDYLVRRFPMILAALDQRAAPAGDALLRLHDLHRRHGAAVRHVIESALDAAAGNAVPASLLALYRSADMADLDASPREVPATVANQSITLILHRQKKEVELVDLGVLSGAAFRLLDCLAKVHLDALGEGLAPEEMPCTTASYLAQMLELDGEDGARRRVMRTRKQLDELFAGAGRECLELIETIHPLGYRLVPEAVRVQVFRPKKPVRAQRRATV